MNLSKIPKLSFVATMILILACVVAFASPAWTGTGNYVGSLWQSYIRTPDEQLTALQTHDVDVGGIPLPEYLDDVIDAGYTVNTMTRIGETFLITNDRVWPTGTATGSPSDADYQTAQDFRKALFRLIDKSEILALYGPLMASADWWLPPGQALWIEMDPASPYYAPVHGVDRMAAVSLLDNAGFTQGSTPNPDYDSGLPWSAEFMRIDPRTGEDLASIELLTINPTDAPLTYESALLMVDAWHTAGIPAWVNAQTFGVIVSRLTNPDLYDFQVIHGVGIVWGSTSPDILYDFTYSENLPLWNFAAQNRSFGSTTDEEATFSNKGDLDYWGEQMFLTLDVARVKKCALELQAIMRDTEPYYPLLLWNTFTSFTGPWAESPGYLGIVNAKGFGATSTYESFSRMLGRAGRSGDDLMIWTLGETLDTLNPMIADTVYDWTVLTFITEGLISLNPYNHKYMAVGADPSFMDFDPAVGYTPKTKPWVGPGRPQVEGDGVYNAAVTYAFDSDTGRMELATYNGIAVNALTDADMQGDDQLGMRTVWKIREDLYWEDSDPGPDKMFGTDDDGAGPDNIVGTADDVGVNPITSADPVFMMNNILIGQENERYFSNWWFVNNYTVCDAYKFEVYEERQYVFAFEGHGIWGPKHIWEADLKLNDADPDNDIHHQFWTGWQVHYMEDWILRRNGMPGWMLSRLIGFGPYLYHIEGPEGIGPGWQPGILTHIETNPAYFGTYTPWFPTGVPGRIKAGDVDLNQLVELPDLSVVIDAFGSSPGIWTWDPKADIAFPAQFIDEEDLLVIEAEFGQTWGPHRPKTIPP